MERATIGSTPTVGPRPVYSATTGAASGASALGTTVERLDLSHLEFELPCDIKTRTKPCDQVAEWVLVLRKHCENDRVHTKLICRPHYLYVVGGGRAFCTVCETDQVVVRDHVLRLERIKP